MDIEENWYYFLVATWVAVMIIAFLLQAFRKYKILCFKVDSYDFLKQDGTFVPSLSHSAKKDSNRRENAAEIDLGKPVGGD